MKNKIPLLLACYLLLIGFTGCVTILGEVASRISPENNGKEANLECLRSSSGSCHFMFGERYETAIVVSAGDSKRIPAPAESIKFCVTFDPKAKIMCGKSSLTAGATVTSTYSAKIN